MASVYVCRFCEQEYQSRSGLRRHLKSKHGEAGLPALPQPVAPSRGDLIAEAEALRPGSGEAGPAAERSEDRPALDKPAKAACKALGIDEDDVMAFKVYHECEPLKVVIIEAPVGHKRVWTAG